MRLEFLTLELPLAKDLKREAKAPCRFPLSANACSSCEAAELHVKTLDLHLIPRAAVHSVEEFTEFLKSLGRARRRPAPGDFERPTGFKRPWLEVECFLNGLGLLL